MNLPSKIFGIFHNSYVHIVTRSLKGSETDGRIRVSGPVVIDGFLLDEDETYFFLGDTPDQITHAVLRVEVVRLFYPIKEMTEALNSIIPTPSDEGDYN